jgi:hypothetical protein
VIEIRHLTALAACLLVSACATDPAEKVVDRSCRNSDPSTGTLIVRREKCVEPTEESRDAARRQLERMQQDQERTRAGARPPGG